MSSSVTIQLPRVIAERIRSEAEKKGITIEEYLLELVSRNLDLKNRALEYIEAARELLEQAREELRKGDVRRAAEKAWGAASLAVKAYASLEGGEEALKPW